MNLTIIILISLGVFLIAYDIFIAVKKGQAATISAQIYVVSKAWPIIPFVFGVIAGHLWWTQ